ncbi:MAG: hypothetical protein LKJ88_07145 [Bacilli bacterium]|nr:hypothetical protein [Bacilli bacterium]
MLFNVYQEPIQDNVIIFFREVINMSSGIGFWGVVGAVIVAAIILAVLG